MSAAPSFTYLLFCADMDVHTQAYHGGAAPCARSSCAATITGDILLLHGGQTPAGVLQDMHLLNLSTLTWLQVSCHVSGWHEFS
jgi:hypothetical protein